MADRGALRAALARVFEEQFPEGAEIEGDPVEVLMAALDRAPRRAVADAAHAVVAEDAGAKRSALSGQTPRVVLVDEIARPRPDLRAEIEALHAAEGRDGVANSPFGAPRVDVSRPAWPEYWWTGGADSEDFRACRALWCDVLRNALLDELARGDAAAKKGHPPEHDVHWLGSRDFRMVCALAGVDAAAVEAQVRRMLREPALREWLTRGNQGRRAQQ